MTLIASWSTDDPEGERNDHLSVVVDEVTVDGEEGFWQVQASDGAHAQFAIFDSEKEANDVMNMLDEELLQDGYVRTDGDPRDADPN